MSNQKSNRLRNSTKSRKSKKGKTSSRNSAKKSRKRKNSKPRATIESVELIEKIESTIEQVSRSMSKKDSHRIYQDDPLHQLNHRLINFDSLQSS